MFMWCCGSEDQSFYTLYKALKSSVRKDIAEVHVALFVHVNIYFLLRLVVSFLTAMLKNLAL